MSITPRGKGFQVYVKRGTKRVRVNAATQAQADAYEAEIVTALEAGREPRLDGITATTGENTLDMVSKAVIARRWSKQRGADTTIYSAKEIVQLLGPNKSINAIDMSDVDLLLEYCEERELGNVTIRKKLSCLKVMLDYASEPGRRWRIVEALNMPWPPVTEGRIRFYDDHEERTILHTARTLEAPEFAELWEFLIDTGARVGEALALTRSDAGDTKVTFWNTLDGETTKGGKPRSVPMTARVKAVMERALARGDRRLFPWDYTQVRWQWNRVRELMQMNGDEQFVIHTCRHTCASRLVQRGVPLPVVQQWMGHKDIKTTMRYAHLAPDSLDQAVGVLEPKSVFSKLKAA